MIDTAGRHRAADLSRRIDACMRKHGIDPLVASVFRRYDSGFAKFTAAVERTGLTMREFNAAIERACGDLYHG